MKKASILLFVLLCLGIKAKAQFDTLYNFNGTNGATPYCSLILSGNRLFGTSGNGGLNHDGVIFSVDTNGKGYKVLFNFNGINGKFPMGALMLSGKVLYGMTESGGLYNYGTIFSIDTNGSGFQKLVDFNDTNGGNPNGGSLILSGKILYGMVSSGGPNISNQNGCVFSIDTNGNSFKDLLAFNGINGQTPLGSLLLSEGVLYGMTVGGGPAGYGNIFSIDTSGNGYKDLHDFGSLGGPGPDGTLIIIGSKLYGMSESDGIYGAGNIFSIDTNGNGYKDLFDFNGTNGTGSAMPLTTSNGFLYGISVGGKYGAGIIFSIDTNGFGYKDIFDLNDIGDGPPSGSFLSGNKFYGTVPSGGINDSGFIFSFRDTIPACYNNFNQSICIVTTDTSINKNIIIWGRIDSPPDGSFNIYDSTSSGWTLISTVPDTALSEYIDTASKPNTQSYSYRISTVDSCGESALSPFNSTIYLQVLQETSGRDSLYWTPYIGFSAPYYLIYRGLTLNALTLIDSVTSSVQTFVDTLPPAGSIYLVEAINPSGGCTPTKRFIHGSSVSTYASISNGGVPKKVTGIGNIIYPKNAVTISPNPNNGKFSVQLGIRNEQLGIKIYNVFGQEVYSTPLPQTPKGALNEINISVQPSGIYFYRVFTVTGNLVSEGKIVKQ